MLPIPEGKVLPNHRHHPMSGILVPIVAKLRETEIIEDAGIFIDSTIVMNYKRQNGQVSPLRYESFT